MAQYDQPIEDVTDNVESLDIDATTQQTITNLLESVGDNVTIDQISAGETPNENADIVITDGIDINDTDASTIIAIGDEPVNISIDSSTEEGIRAIVGSGGGDSISIQGGDAVVLDAGNGNDSVSTGNGDDTIIGGAGNDSVSTGAGSDSVSVGSGADSVNTGQDWDVVSTTLTSDETDFWIDEEGQVVINNLETHEETIIDNAEYLEFADGTTHLVAGEYNDEALDIALTQAINEGEISVDGFSDDQLIDLISDYLDSSEFETNSEDITNLVDLVQLVYENVLDTDVDSNNEQLTDWIDAAHDVLISNNDGLDLLDDSSELSGEISLTDDFDIGTL